MCPCFCRKLCENTEVNSFSQSVTILPYDPLIHIPDKSPVRELCCLQSSEALSVNTAAEFSRWNWRSNISKRLWSGVSVGASERLGFCAVEHQTCPGSNSHIKDWDTFRTEIQAQGKVGARTHRRGGRSADGALVLILQLYRLTHQSQHLRAQPSPPAAFETFWSTLS